MSNAVRTAGRRPSRSGPLTAGQRADFERDGYLVLHGVFGDAEMLAVQHWTDALAATPEASGQQWVYREESRRDPSIKIVQRIENFCPFHRDYDRFIRHGLLIELVADLFGETAVLFKEKINFKMPGGSGFKAHQDQQAGWSRFAPIFITAMVSIDATTPANGCLEIAACRHKQGLLGEEWRPLDEAEARLELAAVPTAPGDVVLFDSFAPHSSKDNLTDTPRRVLYLTYNRGSDGDHRAQYYREKHAAFPPDIDRVPGREYVFRV